MIDSFRARLSAQKQGHEPYTMPTGTSSKDSLAKTASQTDVYLCKRIAGCRKSQSMDLTAFILLWFFHPCGSFCASPLEAHIERLSDGAWLKIIATPGAAAWPVGNAQHRPSYVVSDHTAFASSLGNRLSDNPCVLLSFLCPIQKTALKGMFTASFPLWKLPH